MEKIEIGRRTFLKSAAAVEGTQLMEVIEGASNGVQIGGT